MRILVFSDSHGRAAAMERAIARQKAVDYIIFLGDVLRDIEDFEYIYPNIKILSVAGNCDSSYGTKSEDFLFCGDRKIMFTHGHTYSVKYTLSQLKTAARSNGSDIVLYGHTHVAHTEYDDGLYIMNPGSISNPREGKPSYGVVEISSAGVFLNIVRMS